MHPCHPRLGLRVNLAQFLLLALTNAFVGAVVGAQRSILPLAGSQHFGLESAKAVTAFVVSFGVTKALMNLVAGRAARRLGRRPVLIAGWVAALPIPLLLFAAQELHAWWIIVAANLFLGVNQGLCWTMTIVMKVDLVGEQRRGLAIGINECAGYTAVAASAFLVTLMATAAAPIRGVIIITAAAAVLGVLIACFFVRETSSHAGLATASASDSDRRAPPAERALGRSHFAAAQAGLVCNLNDAVIWTLLPALLAARSMESSGVGLYAGLYPATWGLAQLFTGWLSDRFGRVPLIVSGMMIQGAGHIVLGIGSADPHLSAAAGTVLLGGGTALAYPTLLAFVADHAAPEFRPRALGTYRFFRDMGYAVGAILAGVLADTFSLNAAIHFSGAVTIASGMAFFALASGASRVPFRASTRH